MSRLLKEMVIVFLGFFAVVYLMFPTLGVFELIPDAIPLVGSVDEAGATLILANVLSYYGIDLTRLFARREEDEEGQAITSKKPKTRRVVRRIRKVPKQSQQPQQPPIEDAEYRELNE